MTSIHLRRLPAAISAIGVVALLSTGGCASAQAQTGPDLNITGEPHFETLTLSSGFPNDPRVVELRAGGGESARGLGPGCVGNIASRPDVRVHYNAGSIFPLNVYAISDDADLTLVINRPDGSWICNDDYSGLNPAVLMDNPMSGQYDIWVGVYSGDFADATLYVSELEPDFSDPLGFGGDFADLDIDGDPYYGTLDLSSGFSNDPRTVSVRAGGSQSASDLGPGCVGSIGTRPDVRLYYDAGPIFPLNIYATSDDDLTLVILDPDGEWLCNDDYDGLDPAVLIDNPLSGRYDIWVGVWGGGFADGTLYISELTPDFGGGFGFDDGFADLDIDGEPYFGTLELSSGFSDDPRIVNLRAGGSQSASDLGPGCVGSIGTRPDVRLHYEAGSIFPLNIYATSDDDLTLVILDPDGEWLCNDDYDGLDPAVLIDNPLSGRYDIWVGVWGGGMAEGRLFISELTPRFDR